jgi:hypothetical protein
MNNQELQERSRLNVPEIQLGKVWTTFWRLKEGWADILFFRGYYREILRNLLDPVVDV